MERSNRGAPAPARAIARAPSPADPLHNLQQRLDWLETHTEPRRGEVLLAREAWATVRLELARVGAALRMRGAP